MSDYLIHHGILGQKWGIRRYQNEDGSLTAAGQKRYRTKSYLPNIRQEYYVDQKTGKKYDRFTNLETSAEKTKREKKAAKGYQNMLNDYDKATTLNRRQSDSDYKDFIEFGKAALGARDRYNATESKSEKEKQFDAMLWAGILRDTAKASSDKYYDLVAKGEDAISELVQELTKSGYKVYRKGKKYKVEAPDA